MYARSSFSFCLIITDNYLIKQKSFINSTLDWRWTWRIMMIWSAVEWLAIVICIPETFQPARLRTKAVALRKKLGRTDLKAPIEMDDRSILQEIVGRLAIPFQILILEPMALLLCIATAILLGIIYMFFSAFDIIYAAHGFTSTQVGLVFIGQIVGVSIGSASQGLWNRYYSTAICEEATGKPAPEEHLRKGVAGAIMLPIVSLSILLFWQLALNHLFSSRSFGLPLHLIPPYIGAFLRLRQSFLESASFGLSRLHSLFSLTRTVQSRHPPWLQILSCVDPLLQDFLSLLVSCFPFGNDSLIIII